MSLSHREPVAIACGADNRYVQPLAVMLKSALVNLSLDRAVEVYIIDGGLASTHKQDLLRSWNRRGVSVRWLLPPESLFTGLPLWGRMPVSTYYKLVLADMLPRTLHKVIWLDCDMVVTADLAWLWDNDLGGHHALAAQDPVVPHVSSRNGVAHYEQLGIPPLTKYFNAGVMVVDLDLWRKHKIPERVFEYLRRHRESVVFWDQEGLNAVLAGNWGELDPRWNHSATVPCPRTSTISVSALAEQRLHEPWIIHFTGNLKPWIYPAGTAFHAIYFQYLDLTAWAGWRPRRSLSSKVIGMYESSRLRVALYPAEERLMHLLRIVTRRYAAEHSR